MPSPLHELTLPPRTRRDPDDYPAHGTADHGWTAAVRDWRRDLGAPTVTGLVHTRDEERFVAEALRSLGWVDELVVVDMHSTDRTAAIAVEEGARVVLHENVGYADPARNFGLAQAHSDWVLVLDADEWMEAELAVSLTEFSRLDPPAVALELPFRSFLCGRWLSGTGWQDEYHTRFFRRGVVRWPEAVHGVPEVDGPLARLPRRPGGEVLHHNFDDVAELVGKTNFYTEREADKLEAAEAGRTWAEAAAAAREELLSRWQPDVDGTRSVALSMTMLFYRFLSHAKRWERSGYPDVEAPSDGRAALRDLVSDAGRRHGRALASFAAGRLEEAESDLRAAVVDALDPELLNDLAVVLAARGETRRAEAVLECCLALDPSRTDAVANLDALRARTAADEPSSGSQPARWRASRTLGGADPSNPERAFPGMEYRNVMSEHAQRYAYASLVLGGRHVLDLGCGTGYGSEILSWTAASVRGFDLWQPEPHERPDWPGGARLAFGHDLCTQPLPPAEGAVMFEVIEHLGDAPAALRTVWGAVDTIVASFPNPVYHGSHHNAYHVNDWTLERFEQELGAAAEGRHAAVRLEHLHQGNDGLLVPGRDPDADYWIVVARGG